MTRKKIFDPAAVRERKLIFQIERLGTNTESEKPDPVDDRFQQSELLSLNLMEDKKPPETAMEKNYNLKGNILTVESPDGKKHEIKLTGDLDDLILQVSKDKIGLKVVTKNLTAGLWIIIDLSNGRIGFGGLVDKDRDLKHLNDYYKIKFFNKNEIKFEKKPESI